MGKIELKFINIGEDCINLRDFEVQNDDTEFAIYDKEFRLKSKVSHIFYKYNEDKQLDLTEFNQDLERFYNKQANKIKLQ